MKVFAALVLFLAGLVPIRADTLNFSSGELIIPDGSTITSVITVPPGGRATESYIANFTFADGTGFAQGDFNDGDQGMITFTVPVINLTIDYLQNPSGYGITANSQIFVSECELFDPSCQVPNLALSLAGPINSIEWGNFPGFSGIASMTYTLEGPASIPEPRTIWLLLIGMFGLAFRRRRFVQD